MFSAETCPHYLLLNDSAPSAFGAVAKCAPPLRSETRRRQLWTALRTGRIDTLGSDHSPAPPAMKLAADYFELWGGIAGVQHGFELLLNATRTTARRDWPRLVVCASTNVAQRFRLPRKGQLAAGFDADFFIVRPNPVRTLRALRTADTPSAQPLSGTDERAPHLPHLCARTGGVGRWSG
jgi:allantoinase